jgi:hypothetical protein
MVLMTIATVRLMKTVALKTTILAQAIQIAAQDYALVAHVAKAPTPALVECC